MHPFPAHGRSAGCVGSVTWLTGEGLAPWEDPDAFLGGMPKGYDVEFYAGGERPASLDEVEFYVPSYMGGGDVLDIVRDMPALKVVQLQTAGFEHVQSRLADGVTLCNARGVHDASTAELAVGLILATYRRLPRAVRDQERARLAGLVRRGRRLARGPDGDDPRVRRDR